jgi:hypothetical protein
VKQRRVWDRRLIEHVATPRLLGAVSIVSAMSLLADGLSPLLHPHAPLALVALVPLVTLRLCLTDPVHFELGRRVPIGPTRHGVFARVGRRLRRLVDAVPASGFMAAVALRPVLHILLAAGADQ